MTREDTANRLMAVGYGPYAWTGMLSRDLLHDALIDSGFDVDYFNWTAFIDSLDGRCPGIVKTRYGSGTRVTIHARRAANPRPLAKVSVAHDSVH
jgi:hypothetical protein